MENINTSSVSPPPQPAESTLYPGGGGAVVTERANTDLINERMRGGTLNE